MKNEWLHTITWLKKTFPATFSVIVRSKALKKNQLGTTFFDQFNGCFEVNICNKQKLIVRIFILLHEWAHVLTYRQHMEKCLKKGTITDFHSDDWGITYAKLHRAWMQWNYGKKKEETL